MPTFHNFSEMPTLLSRVKRAMSADSVELMALRICCCAMPCALLLYLLIQYRAFGSDYIGDWYGYLISIGLASCGVFMLVAAIVGKLTWLRYSLYWNAVVLVTAMIMFPVAYYTMTDLGPSILRFTDFTGLLAISVVLLSPTKRAVIAAILIQAIPGAMHAIVYSRTSLPELITASGFAVLMSLIPFVLGAVTLMRVARTIDEIEERVRNSLADSECKRAGIAERKRLNGLVHDHILASLAAIARGQTLTASSTLSLPSRPATGRRHSLAAFACRRQTQPARHSAGLRGHCFRQHDACLHQGLCCRSNSTFRRRGCPQLVQTRGGWLPATLQDQRRRRRAHGGIKRQRTRVRCCQPGSAALWHSGFDSSSHAQHRRWRRHDHVRRRSGHDRDGALVLTFRRKPAIRGQCRDRH